MRGLSLSLRAGGQGSLSLRGSSACKHRLEAFLAEQGGDAFALVALDFDFAVFIDGASAAAGLVQRFAKRVLFCGADATKTADQCDGFPSASGFQATDFQPPPRLGFCRCWVRLECRYFGLWQLSSTQCSKGILPERGAAIRRNPFRFFPLTHDFFLSPPRVSPLPRRRGMRVPWRSCGSRGSVRVADGACAGVRQRESRAYQFRG